MTRARQLVRITTIVCAAAMLAAGCGGGEAVAPDTGTPTPGSTGPAATVSTTPGATTTPGVTTTPLDGTVPALGTDDVAAGAAATVPRLDGGDDVGGSFGGSSTGLFDPKASEDAGKVTSTTDFEDSVGSSETETTRTAETQTYSGAVIYVDGTTYKVTRGASFPKGSPILRLISITSTDIEVELIAGEFTTGGGMGTILDKGDLVTVVNSSEQVNYRVKYLRPIVDSTGIDL